MRITDIQVGDVLRFWTNVGTAPDGSHVDLSYAKVVKTGKVKVKVQCEWGGSPAWKYPAYFSSKVKPGEWVPEIFEETTK